MGVITRLHPIEEIIEELDPKEPLAVISCNNCVKASGAGGEGVWESFCDELKKRGFRVEDRVLITNPCSRGYLEDLTLSPVVKTVIMFACEGALNGFKTLFPDIKLIAAIDTMGLFISSKADGVVKLMLPFPGYEDLKGKEFKLGDSRSPQEGEKLVICHAGG
ncbi:MAG: hypothetical protein GXP25_03590 [Planctomycetes bacterium]|nr:hypothetical protein [Planctomycetota bacterium]